MTAPRLRTTRQVVDALEPDHRRDTRQARHVAIEPLEGGRPARHRRRGRIAGWRRDAVAADAGVDDRDARPVLLVQATRQDVGPAIVAVQRRRRAVGNRIAEARHDHHVRRRATTSTASRKYQEVVVNGNAASLSSRPWLPARGAVTYDVGERLGVPGHRSGRSDDMKADDELAPGEERIGWTLHEVQHDRVTRRTRASRNRHARPAALEPHLPIRPRRDIAAAALQADKHIVERDGTGAEDIAQAEARCLPPQVGLDDQAKRLVDGTLGCGFEDRREVGLSRWIAGWIRTVR